MKSLTKPVRQSILKLTHGSYLLERAEVPSLRAGVLSERALIGRRECKKVVTRDELLRAGRRYFAEKGLYESRVEDLTRFAGIAKGTFYLYYETKEDLVHAVVVDGFDQLQSLLSASMTRAMTIEEISRTIVESHVAFYAANPDLMRIFHQVRGILKFDRREWLPLRRALKRHVDFLARLLSTGTSERLSTKIAEDVACLLFGGLSGVLSVQVATNPRSPVPPRLPRVADAFVGLTRAYLSRER